MPQEKQIQDILEIVTFIKDNAATKSELDERLGGLEQRFDQKLGGLEERLTLQFDEKLSNLKDELITHIDGFIVLHQKLDTELTALRSKCDRLETQVAYLMQHLNLKME